MSAQPTTPSSDVFISYSRSDREHAERLANELRARGFGVSRDVENILPTEEWKGRLHDLICQADAVVFLLSPRSATSDICAWEIELASSLNKKIAPIVVEDVSGSAIPPMLSRLNYIFATERDRFENAVRSLSDALSMDVEWIREHTRLTTIATHWDSEGRPDDILLRGVELNGAVDWLGKRPKTVPEPCQVLNDLLEHSLRNRDSDARYTEERLRALSILVEPILQKRIEELTKQATEWDKQWEKARIRISNSDANERRGEIDSIRNFFADGGRWHPQPAEYLKNAGAHGDYAEVYQFPCCGSYAVLKDEGKPLQFRSNGCQKRLTQPQS